MDKRSDRLELNTRGTAPVHHRGDPLPGAVEAKPERMVEVPCALCQGAGKDKYGNLSLATCPTCGGRGQRTMHAPVVRCAFCRGLGVHRGTRLTCTACRGWGTVEAPHPAVTCPQCRGNGKADGNNLYCARCHGKGLIPAE